MANLEETMFREYDIRGRTETYFKLTDSSFQRLRDDKIPNEVLESLKSLVNKEFDTKEELLNAVENRIGKGQTDKYKGLILKHTRTDELTPDTVEIIAKAYGTMLRKKNIDKAVIGHDFRKDSEWITTAAIEGLRSTGINVINLGMTLTPMMYSAQYYYKTEGGVMITASHNPSGWAGFKLALGYSQTLGKKEIEKLRQLTINENFVSGNGTVRTGMEFFKLTKFSFQELRKDGIPDTVLESLESLKDKEFDTKENLLKDVKNQIGKEQTVEYEYLILKHATENFTKHYEKDLLSRIDIGRKLTVVVNTGNGTPGPIVPPILRKAGCAVIKLYTQLDWDFPVYFPNPARVDMMEETGRKVVEIGADIGLAFDGDGDRLGITDEKGNIIWPDRFLILLARQVLEKHPGAKIVFDVKCTQALPEDIKEHGGDPIEWMTGHSYIKKKVFEEKAPLGGEMSGHIFISKPEYHGFDDAVFTALKLIEYLSHQEKTMSEIIAETPSYVSSPTLNVSCADEVKYGIVEELVKDFKKGEEKEGYKISTINGVKIYFEDGWGLVRASSNLPVLVLRFEAKTPKRLEEIKDIFKQKFSKYPGKIGNEWETG